MGVNCVLVCEVWVNWCMCELVHVCIGVCGMDELVHVYWYMRYG